MKRLIAAALCCIGIVSSSCLGEQSPTDDLSQIVSAVAEGVAWVFTDFTLCLQLSGAIDYANPTTRAFVLGTVHPSHSGDFNIAQVCDFWEVCQAQWLYFSDPQGLFADFTPASVTIHNYGLRGDCDDFATVIAAGVRGLGGNAMVRCEHASTSGHAYTEVYIGSDEKTAAANLFYVLVRYGLTLGDVATGDVGVRLTSDWGYWLNLDWSANRPGGHYWAAANQITESHYFPFSASFLWAFPFPLNAPGTSSVVAIIASEFIPAQVQAALSMTPSGK